MWTPNAETQLLLERLERMVTRFYDRGNVCADSRARAAAAIWRLAGDDLNAILKVYRDDDDDDLPF